MSDYDDPKVCSLQLLEEDVKTLIDLLNFTKQAANMLAAQETQKGGTIVGAVRYDRMSRDARDLSALLIKHVDMGEPSDGQIH